jgi:hypothetical protein
MTMLSIAPPWRPRKPVEFCESVNRDGGGPVFSFDSTAPQPRVEHVDFPKREVRHASQ